MNKISHADMDRVHLNSDSRYGKRSTCLFQAMIILFFIAACSSSWEPSDTEAVDLVKNHYLYYSSGKEIDAKIIERGAYIKECKCFPLKFRITDQKHEHFEKTFYFFKDESGKVELSEYQIHN